jgi:hypothetical protein
MEALESKPPLNALKAVSYQMTVLSETPLKYSHSLMNWFCMVPPEAEAPKWVSGRQVVDFAGA